MGNSTGCCTESELEYNQEAIKLDRSTQPNQMNGWQNKLKANYYRDGYGNIRYSGMGAASPQTQEIATPVTYAGFYKLPQKPANPRNIEEFDASAVLSDYNRRQSVDPFASHPRMEDIDNQYYFTPAQSHSPVVDGSRFGKRSLDLELNDISLVNGKFA